MKIEYIYPDSKDEKDLKAELKQMQKENTIGCLIAGLVLLSAIFILLALLPIILTILGWSMLTISAYIIYKVYVEEHIEKLISWLKNRHQRK